MSDESRKLKRTRSRIPVTCGVCRAKKLKCDKQRPHCGRCVALNWQHLCHYEEQPWESSVNNKKKAKNDNLESQVESLKATIGDLYDLIQQKQQPQKLSQLQQHPTQTKSASPQFQQESQTYQNVITKPLIPTIIPSCSTNESDSRPPKESESSQPIKPLNMTKKPTAFTMKNLNFMNPGPTSYMYYVTNESNLAEIFSSFKLSQVQLFKTKYTSLGVLNKLQFTDSGNITSIDNCTKVEKSTNSISFPPLPSLDTIVELMQRFFKICSVFVPFINGNDFITEVIEILSTDIPIEVLATGPERFTVAMIYIITRFSYLSIPLNSTLKCDITVNGNGNIFNHSQDISKRISKDSIELSLKYIECAKRLIVSTEILSSNDFKKIQATLLLKVYSLHCPEFDERSANSNVLCGLTIQLARFHGLNNDPEEIHFSSLTTQDLYLWRKTWAFFVYTDAYSAFENGHLPLVQPIENRTHEPFKDLSSDSLWLPSQEFKLARGFKIRQIVSEIISKYISYVNNHSQIKDENVILEFISQFDDILYNKLNTFESLFKIKLEPSEIQFIVDEIILRISILNYKFVVQFYLYLYCNEVDKEKYLTTALESAFILLFFCKRYATNPTSMVPAEFYVLTAPYIWNPLKNVVLFLSSITLQGLRRMISITKILNQFNNIESQKALKEFNLNTQNELELHQNLINIFEGFYETMIELSGKFFHTFYLCYTLRVIRDFLRNAYPDTLSDYNSGNTLDQCSPISKTSTPEFVNKFWQAPDFMFNLEFEDYLNELKFNSDPFLN